MNYPMIGNLNRRSTTSIVFRTILLALWVAIRLPALALLVILEPFVTIFFMGVATLGVFTCILFEFVFRAPHFPFLLMLSLSLGSALILFPYYGLIRFFSRSA